MRNARTATGGMGSGGGKSCAATIAQDALVPLGSGGYGKYPVVLEARQTLEFAVQDGGGGQKYLLVDVIHCDPTQRGKGTPQITWSVRLEWYVGVSGTEEWRKVVSVVNKSRSRQPIEVLLQDLPLGSGTE